MIGNRTLAIGDVIVDWRAKHLWPTILLDDQCRRTTPIQIKRSEAPIEQHDVRQFTHRCTHTVARLTSIDHHQYQHMPDCIETDGSAWMVFIVIRWTVPYQTTIPDQHILARDGIIN